MRRDTIVADNFYDDPDGVVLGAQRLEYVPPYQSAEEVARGAPVTWITSRFRSTTLCPFKGSEALIARLEFLVGERINMVHWRRDYPVDHRGFPVPAPGGEVGALWNCSFHAKLATKQQAGEGVHNHVTDVWNHVGEDGWAGILYLNRETNAQAGLRTWRNVDVKRNFDWMTPKENWAPIDTFASVFNRLILHRGGIPHSGAAGWGTQLRDARFFQTFFFKTLRVASAPGVRIADLAGV
jgi:hypothetical protein